MVVAAYHLVMADMTTGPVFPLYLTMRETRCLALAVGTLLSLDQGILHNPEARASAEARDVGRADQIRSAVQERLPVLLSLQTALVELGSTLERMEQAE
jgi:hypothetical protein